MKSTNYLDNILVALDIGTTKICVLVAQQNGPNSLEIIGVGKAPSDGLRKGVVVDIEKTVHSIKQAIAEAELMAGCPIQSACIGVSGGHIQSMNSQGVVPIKRGQITHADISNVLASAKAIAIPEGQQLLHVLPQFFIIDSHERVYNPLGMHGIRLEAQVHMITGSISSVQNLVKCCQMANLKVTDIVLEQLASARAVCTPDELILGVGVLDIGGGTSDLALYQHGSIVYTKVLPIAGNHFTNDVAIGLRTTRADAERIKKEHGLAFINLLEHDIPVQYPSVAGDTIQEIMMLDLVSIIQPRAEEIFSIIGQTIMQQNLSACMTTGLVLTGGGAMLSGMKELASDMLAIPVRIGTPQSKTLLACLDNPMYATGYGLLLHALEKRDTAPMDIESGPLATRIMARMKSWVSDFF